MSRVWLWLLAAGAAVLTALAFVSRSRKVKRVAINALLKASDSQAQIAHDRAIEARVKADEAQAALDLKIEKWNAARNRHEKLSSEAFMAKWAHRIEPPKESEK